MAQQPGKKDIYFLNETAIIQPFMTHEELLTIAKTQQLLLKNKIKEILTDPHIPTGIKKSLQAVVTKHPCEE